MEIEEAIEALPAPQVEELAVWLERHRPRKVATPVSEPDFLARAKAVWGEAPSGSPLSALVSEARGNLAFSGDELREIEAALS